MLYVLDFAGTTPRWRQAQVRNINVEGSYQFAFPNSGVAAVPELGALGLKHRLVRGRGGWMEREGRKLLKTPGCPAFLLRHLFATLAFY